MNVTHADLRESPEHARPAPSPRRLAAGVKRRLQFTGWLQYLVHALAVLIVAAVAAALAALDAPTAVVAVPTALATVLTGWLALDLITVKCGLRPSEAMPLPPANLDPFDLMRLRRSCRSFQTRNLTERHRDALLQAAQAATRPERLLGEHPIRLEYVAANLTVWPVVGAHEFLVAIAPREYDRTAVMDVGRSLQRVVLQATRMGVATCWIGPGANHASVTAHLRDRIDEAKDHIICVCAIGYRSRFVPLLVSLANQKMHRRLPLSSLFFADPARQRPLNLQAPALAAYGRCFEVCQWSPSSYNGQTTRCTAVTDRPDGTGRPTRFDFYSPTTSRFYAPVAIGIWGANWEIGCAALGLPGHLAVLPAEQIGSAAGTSGPPCDGLSWVVDQPVVAARQAPERRPGRSLQQPGSDPRRLW